MTEEVRRFTAKWDEARPSQWVTVCGTCVLASDHDRVVAEFKAENERGFQVLEMFGVPRERARSVSNGIMVLEQRMTRENESLRQQLADAQAELERAMTLLREAQDIIEMQQQKMDTSIDRNDEIAEAVQWSTRYAALAQKEKAGG